MTTNNTFLKSPQAVIDFKFDWRAYTNGSINNDEVTDWLQSGETITSFVITSGNAISTGGSTVLLAVDSGKNNLSATYSPSVVLGGSVNRAWFNGINSYVNIYSASLRTKFNGDEGTIITRCKTNSPAIWTDGFHRTFLDIGYFDYMTSGGANLLIQKSNVNNKIDFFYTLDSGTYIFQSSAFSSLSWFSAGMTFSQSLAQWKAYLDGTQAGVTQAIVSPWQSNLVAADLGSGGAHTGTLWNGWMSDCIIGFGLAASPAQMLSIHNTLNAGTLTTSALDSIFGVGNYAWWKLDENQPITINSSSLTNSNTSVTVWLSGGEVYQDYDVSCKITTNQNRTDERTIKIQVRDR